MTLEQRIDLLQTLGEQIDAGIIFNDHVKRAAQIQNPWFTIESIDLMLKNVRDAFLEKSKLEKWLAPYEISNITKSKNVGLIVAGNIPLVGLHDLISIFLTGHRAILKLSDKDKVLMTHFIQFLGELDPRINEQFSIVPQLKGYDAVIATGSNNSALKFDFYFKKYPRIIRRNRNGVGVLFGDESTDDFIKLGHDVFDYFGLGCRNVSKLYVPQGYDFRGVLDVWHEHYKDLANHNKYKNNFDYNYAIYLLNKREFLMTGSLILREDASLSSRIASVHYETYENTDSLIQLLNESKDEIQNIVSAKVIDTIPVIPLGTSQRPQLDEFADGIDTIEFLTKL